MTALSFPAVAAAQSNVVLFGVADASVRVVNGGNGTAYSIGSGGLAASRFGIRTQEDLGNGIAAGAWMEGTVNYNDGTGNSSRFWNRRATVSLLGPLGEVRLGHDLTPGYTSFGEFDTFGVSGLADQGKFYSTAFGSGIEATGLWARADNMISYFTPNSLGGFYANLATAFGENVPAKKYNGGRIGYASGPLNVTAAYSVFDGLKGNLKRSALAASYDFGVVRFLASTVRNQYLSAARQVTQVGVVVPISPAASVRANYTRASESGALNGASIDPNHATQIAMGFTYDFSKRTTVYGTLVYLANKGTSAFNFGASQPPGSRLRGGELGVSHRF